MENKKIVLGSGTLYCKEYVNAVPTAIEIETEANILGEIKGGATLEYKPEYYTAEDDFGKISKRIITKEDVTFKSGIITWNGLTLQKLCGSARVADDKTLGKRTIKIGGLANQDGKKYAFEFLHKDKADGDLRIMIVGNNQSGFSMVFAKDKETTVDAVIKAEAQDVEGTLILITEDIQKGGV
ncbi:MAG: hypothetical protein RR458_04010 [Clostridia bacterium]